LSIRIVKKEKTMAKLPTIHVRNYYFDKVHDQRSAEFSHVLKGKTQPDGTELAGGVMILKEINGDLGHKLRVDLVNLDKDVMVFAPEENLCRPQEKKVELRIVSFQELYNSLPKEALDYDNEPIYNREMRFEHGYWKDDKGETQHGLVAAQDWMPIYSILKQFYAYIVDILMREAQREGVWNAALYFGKFDSYGDQATAHWAASDLDKKQEAQYNWHGQNTSQWLYAGGLMFSKRRFEEWKQGKDVPLFSVHT
jgi:hypothetical protein